MQVPSEDDWRSEPWCIDMPYAYAHFFGLTIEEATKLFEENALNYSEDVMWMPKLVFRYYVKAFAAYMMSEASRGDADAANCFVGLILFKAEHDPDDVKSAWNEIEQVLEKIALEQFDFYDAEWSIYRDFRKKMHELVERGFSLPFDTTAPENVPDGITIAEMAPMVRHLPIDIALPILVNSGIEGIDLESTPQQVVDALGTPESRGGGVQTKHGFIDEWIRFRRDDYLLRFGFKDSKINSVTIMYDNDPLQFAISQLPLPPL